MSHKTKTDQIFDLIGDLRYAEMLSLAQYFTTIAIDVKLSRSSADSWAKMLHAATQIHKGE